MAAITESDYLGGADLSAHSSFRTDRVDGAGKATAESAYDTRWGAGNANDWATALAAIHGWMRGASPVTGNALFEGDVTLDGASPSLAVGDGTGSPDLTLNKTDTGTADIGFEVGGTRRWIVQMETDEDFAVNRYDSGGLFQDNLRIQASTGRLDLPHDLLMDRPSATIDLGDGTGNPEIATSKGAGGQTTINLYHGGTSATADAKQLLHDTDETLSLRHYNGSSWDVALRITNNALPEVPSYTVGTLPSAADAGCLIYVSDETGGATIAFSDGTNWRRVQDRQIVA